MTRENIRFRQRYCSMTRKDEDEFSALLRAKMPDLLIYQYDHEKKEFLDYPSIIDADGDVAIGLRDPGGGNGLVQRPQRFFSFRRAYIGAIDLSKVKDDKGIVKPIDFRGRRFTREGEMQGFYKVGDLDKKRFIDKAFRLSANFMTNAFDVYDLRTGKHIDTITKGVAWSGPDVIRLCREEKNFVCSVFFRSDLDTWTGYKAIPRP